MRKVNKRKKISSTLVVLVMTIAFLLTACGSSQVTTSETENTKVEDSTKTIQEQITEPTEVSEPEIKEEKQEVVVQEKEEEPIEEDPYAGIDMESTLPGLEWIATFDGIIEEPTAIIYSDETNKKIIVKEGDEVEFSRTEDMLALYSPNINTMPIIITVGGFYNGWRADQELPDAATSTREIICEEKVWTEAESWDCVFTALYRGKEKEYKFTLKFVE